MNALRGGIGSVARTREAAVPGFEIIRGLEAGAVLACRHARADLEPTELVAPGVR